MSVHNGYRQTASFYRHPGPERPVSRESGRTIPAETAHAGEIQALFSPAGRAATAALGLRKSFPQHELFMTNRVILLHSVDAIALLFVKPACLKFEGIDTNM